MCVYANHSNNSNLLHCSTVQVIIESKYVIFITDIVVKIDYCHPLLHIYVVSMHVHGINCVLFVKSYGTMWTLRVVCCHTYVSYGMNIPQVKHDETIF